MANPFIVGIAAGAGLVTILAAALRKFQATDDENSDTDTDSVNDEFREKYEKTTKDIEEKNKKITDLSEKNSDLKKINNDLEKKNNDLEKIIETKKLNRTADKTLYTPKTMAEAVECAENKFPHLEILESAKASASNSPFRRPYDVFLALSILNEYVEKFSDAIKDQNEEPPNLLEFLKKNGGGRRCSMHISKPTKNKHGSHYKFKYQGEKTLFEPHITIGSGGASKCASIHFIFDEEKMKIVIGHVGRHLPNTRT